MASFLSILSRSFPINPLSFFFYNRLDLGLLSRKNSPLFPGFKEERWPEV
jgi:hypothetical protein